jgi:hypothetical protein
MQVGKDPGVERAPIAEDRSIDAVIFQKLQKRGLMLSAPEINLDRGNDSNGAAMRSIA